MKYNIVTIPLLLVLIVGGVFATHVGPHYWVKYKMDEVVQVTVLEWRDFQSMRRAQDRLPRELEKYEIPSYIILNDCTIFEEKGEKHVKCDWSIDVRFPLVEYKHHLDFVSHKFIDADLHLNTVD